MGTLEKKNQRKGWDLFEDFFLKKIQLKTAKQRKITYN